MPAVTPPNTVTQLSHAMTIVANGQSIGAINEWGPKMTQTVTELFEFGVVNTRYSQLSGEPYEKVPGNVGGMTIDVRRYDLYTTQMEAAFGNLAAPVSYLHMLSNQRSPFEVREVWTTPSNSGNYASIYRGCWFSNIGRTISSTGDRLINVNATLEYTRRDRISV